MAEEQAAATNADKQILIQKLYMKDASFEAPNTPAVYSKEWHPSINLNIQTRNTLVTEDLHEVVLIVTAEAKLEDETAFIVEIQQAGLFMIKGFSEEESRQIIGAYCPNLLFPFAREAVTDFVGKGGFPGLLLQPINFDALYLQQMQEMAQASEEAASPADKH